jgi:hypothetical protein
VAFGRKEAICLCIRSFWLSVCPCHKILESRPSEDTWLSSRTGGHQARNIDCVISAFCQEFCKPAVVARTAIVSTVALPT